MREIDRGERRGIRSWWVTVPLSAIALASACAQQPTAGGSATSTRPAEASGAPQGSEHSETTVTTTTTQPGRRVGALATLTFTDLHGGDPTVMTYAGPRDKNIDKRVTGTYYGKQNDPRRSADTMPVECVVTDGRNVASHPKEGEDDVPGSETWYRLAITGDPQFATKIYGNIAPAEQAALPECDLSQLDEQIAAIR